MSGTRITPDTQAATIASWRLARAIVSALALGCGALALWTGFGHAEAAASSALADPQRDEFRGQAIAPLALGGDSGRRLAATAALVPLAHAPERPDVVLTATLGQGDSFARMLQRSGVGGDEARQIAAVVSDSVPLSDIAAGTRFTMTLGRRSAATQPRPLEDLAFRARIDLALTVERRGGGFAVVRKPIAVDATPMRIRGIVGASLYRSARAAGVPATTVQQYLRALGGHLSLTRDVLPSDTFDIVVAHQRAATGEVAVGNLVYAGLDRAGRGRAQLLRWDGDRFFEASGVGRRRGHRAAPVAGRISSPFGPRRHPILGHTRMHAGIDFRAAWGTPIHATDDGVVTFAGRRGGHGNHVRLAHADGIGSGYSHMSRIAVAPGMQVRAGQVIGHVGSTGLSTGPHLHYELYRHGRTVNPAAAAAFAPAQLEGEELAAFRARLAAVLQVRPGAALAR